MGKIEPNEFEFEFYDGTLLYKTKPTYFQTKSQDIDFICQGGEIEVKRAFSNEPDSYENKITLSLEQHNSEVLIFTPYMLINKTNQNLVFGQKGSSKKNDDFVCVQKFTCDYFHPKSNKSNKYSIKTDGYRWSKPFNINTIGVSGMATMKRFTDDNGNDNDEIIEKYNPSHLDYGITLSTLSHPFGGTNTITFVPRYYLINETGRDLIVTQGHTDSTKQYYLQDNK